jgi:hypothetical protein
LIPAEAPRLETTILVPEMPPLKVLVAVAVERIDPPVSVKPFAPPRLVARMPPENVLVAVLVFRIEPPVMVSPLADTRPPPFTERPLPVQVEVAAPEV